ncbi:hypothetical protein AKJ65_01325 [candidate division MSBL1 archaeon SCGC-AAA259E19]|uniref:Uncharacterized protein n=1 Tax=candidate division MSBL1 archaeon SCGC-AAA259E19 TaxID=1698264 RepID=A0A133UN48_9EURY|nr:hypothetical protein AKJ65_01325 [candidate division MSBL1 archaeon SCGC-AAA259E19]
MCSECKAENLKLLADREVILPASSFVTLADTLHLREIWRSGPEDIRKTVAGSRANLHFHDDYTKGAWLSLFSLLLCLAANINPSPSKIAEVASDEGYRERLLEKANKHRNRVACRLRDLGELNEVAEAFWRHDGEA